jgi:putative Mg2+ transporter-C (MgtC) family protein
LESIPQLDAWELISRILIAAALGGLVGFERELSDQPAGLRTHILVSLGAALFTMVGAYGVESFFTGDEPAARFDPTRIAAQVVTGIGFLGAGAILRQGVNIRGLTTAAALWVTAAIGTAVGLGFIGGAIVVTVVALVSLYGLKRVRKVLVPKLQSGARDFSIEVGPELEVPELAEMVQGLGLKLKSMKPVTDEDGNSFLVGEIRLSPKVSSEEFARLVTSLKGVRGFEWVD